MFGKNYWKQNMCFDFLYKICLKHFQFWEEFSDVLSYMYICLHVKYPLFLLDFNQTWIFSIHFRRILKYQFSWPSVQWEPSLTIAFRNFAKAPINHGQQNWHPCLDLNRRLRINEEWLIRPGCLGYLLPNQPSRFTTWGQQNGCH
jgi:hypothetical protein